MSVSHRFLLEEPFLKYFRLLGRRNGHLLFPLLKCFMFWRKDCLFALWMNCTTQQSKDFSSWLDFLYFLTYIIWVIMTFVIDSWVLYFTTVFSHKVPMQRTSAGHVEECRWACYQPVKCKLNSEDAVLPWTLDFHLCQGPKNINFFCARRRVDFARMKIKELDSSRFSSWALIKASQLDSLGRFQGAFRKESCEWCSVSVPGMPWAHLNFLNLNLSYQKGGLLKELNSYNS